MPKFSKGTIPADTTERILKVEDGIVTRKEVNGKVYYRARCAMTGKRFWEDEGTPFFSSISSETYWCS